MRPIRSLLVLVAALALVLAASSAQAAEKGKAKHHGHAVRGVVTAVSTNSVTIKVAQHHKKGAAATAAPTEATEMTFAINGETKYFFVSGKKGKKGEAKAEVKKGENMKPATFADVKQGEHVVVVAIKGDAKNPVAKVILIREKKEKKPTA